MFLAHGNYIKELIENKINVSIVIAISEKEGLSKYAENIGKLLDNNNYYFVPFKQNNPITKPRSIMFDIEYLIKTIEYALEGKQISPILLSL